MLSGSLGSVLSAGGRFVDDLAASRGEATSRRRPLTRLGGDLLDAMAGLAGAAGVSGKLLPKHCMFRRWIVYRDV